VPPQLLAKQCKASQYSIILEDLALVGNCNNLFDVPEHVLWLQYGVDGVCRVIFLSPEGLVEVELISVIPDASGQSALKLKLQYLCDQYATKTGHPITACVCNAESKLSGLDAMFPSTVRVITYKPDFGELPLLEKEAFALAGCVGGSYYCAD
jgi:hypothetical protein